MKMRWMRQAGAVVLGGILAASLTACGGGTSHDGAPADQAGNGKRVVTISVLQADNFLKSAAQAYEQAHPDISIQFKEYAATPDTGDGSVNLAVDPATVEKYVNSVGTEVLSGKGADLIELQKLPIAKYAGKKALVDLNELMSKDSSFDAASYYGNILDATKVNGGLYAMPLGFSLNMMVGDKASIEEAGVSIDDKSWTWEKFAELAKRLVKDSNGDGKPDKYAITNFDPETMVINLLGDHYSQYVDPEKKLAHFDSEAFEQLLKQVKSMYDEGLVSAESASWGEQFFSPWKANSPSDLALYPLAAYGEGGAVYRKPGSGSGITFTTSAMFGINARSKVQQEAWGFVKFLLSEEMQSSPNFKSIPLNKTVVNEELDQMQEQLKQGTMKLINGFVPEALTDAELRRVKAIIADAGRFTKSDPKINAILNEDLPTYFAGQKSAEEVGRLIQSRVTTYLNE